MKKSVLVSFLVVVFLLPLLAPAQDQPVSQLKPDVQGSDLITPLNPNPIPIDEALSNRLKIMGKPARNVILYVVDGFNSGALTLARSVLVGRDKLLEVDRFPVIGRMIIFAKDFLVTDSAAAATAFATGVTVPRNRVSQDDDGKPLLTIAEAAHKLGFKVGLVTTTAITDATPAAFAAHVENRTDKNGIARQMVNSGFEVLMGGGRECFHSQEEGGSQPKGVNPVEDARKAGYTVAQNRKQLEEFSAAGKERILGLFNEDDLPMGFEEPNPMIPTLPEMVAAALGCLSKADKGFFLMVESGSLDTAQHFHDAAEVVAQLKTFNQTLQMLSQFAQTRTDTLIVVISDHGTGGLTITEEFDSEKFKKSATSTMSLAAEFWTRKEALPDRLKVLFPDFGFPPEELTPVLARDNKLDFQTFLGSLVNEKFGFVFLRPEKQVRIKGTWGHTAEDQFLHAQGNHQGLFGGVMHSYEIPRRIAAAMGFAFP